VLWPANSGSKIFGLTHSAELSQIPLLPDELAAQKALFLEGKLDQDLQQKDLREHNSWRMRLAEVPSVERLEVPPVMPTLGIALCLPTLFLPAFASTGEYMRFLRFRLQG